MGSGCWQVLLHLIQAGRGCQDLLCSCSPAKPRCPSNCAFLNPTPVLPALLQIWKLVKSPDVIAREGKGLSRHRFAQVLRLIALAQCSDYPFTQENAGAALHSNTWLDLHGVPLPPPRVGGLQAQQPAEGVDGQAAAEPAAPEQQQQPQQQQQPRPDSVGGAQGQADAADSASDASGAAGLLGGDLALSAGVAGSSGAAPAPYDYDDDDLFGLRALQVRAASHGASTSDEAAARAAALATDAAAAAAAEDTAAPSSGGMVRRMSRSIAVSDQNRIQRVHTGARALGGAARLACWQRLAGAAAALPGCHHQL